jgi:predicted nucleic acid-binding protein
MIQLDSNYLILGTVASTLQSADLQRWLSQREVTSTSAVAWMEFVTGPVGPELVETVRQIIEDRIVPIGREEAELAATLFNAVGRKRALRYDCLIAATAIRSGARLATANRSDFSLFVPYGLDLV